MDCAKSMDRLAKLRASSCIENRWVPDGSNEKAMGLVAQD